MNKVAIIQARMSSARLPGKVLREINGEPLLAYQIRRARRAKLIDTLVVATSLSNTDDEISDFCRKFQIECFRGSKNDVLNRYYRCAKKYNADIVIRLCADNPLVDPVTIDELIQFYMTSKVDYASNGCPPETTTFPDGADLEVFSMEALKRAHLEASSSHDREHVTFYLWKYGNGFSTAQFTSQNDWSEYRYTVDYPEDFEVVRFVIKELSRRQSFGHLEEIVRIIEQNPRIKEINSSYYFGIGWEQ